MRMFAALLPPQSALEDLAEFLAPRQEAGGDLRWTQEEQWHITLAFMAEIPERAVERVIDGIADTAATRAPFTLSLAGAGAFPHPHDARVLWTGVSGDETALSALSGLARGVRRACTHGGGAPAGGRFRGHGPLARARRPLEATRWLRVLEAYAGPSWSADEVTVIASHLGEGRGGRPRYEHLAAAPLAGR
jgi:2'-5' RNA ligase